MAALVVLGSLVRMLKVVMSIVFYSIGLSWIDCLVVGLWCGVDVVLIVVCWGDCCLWG